MFNAEQRFWNLSLCPAVLECYPIPHESKLASYGNALVQLTRHIAWSLEHLFG